MDNSQTYSSLSCEIQIIRAKNVERRSLGSSLFVRCNLSAGEHERVQINSQEIPSESADLFWNESFSLDCSGTDDSINNLKQESVVFELHSRKIFPILGKVGGSRILGWAEIPWKNVFESTNMEIVEWAVMGKENVKPMAVQIAMKVRVKETIKVKKNDKLRRSSSWNKSCACMDYCGCNSSSIFSADDYEVFALGAALGAL